MSEIRSSGAAGTTRATAVAAAVVRWPRPWLYGLTAALVLTDAVSDALDLGPDVPGPVLLAAAALALGTEPLRWFVTRRGGRGDAEPVPVEIAPPVAGRWSALNSPADKVPSHGVRAYGQAYAIDVARESEERPRPAFGWWPPTRRNGAFPSFGEPVLAVADATVVRVRDGRRDHLGRNSFPALPFFFLEASFRDAFGLGPVVGNHLILDLGDGTHALYAHLKRGSAVVHEGERVRTGQVLARVGNSGNSTEPHLHFQLMDSADPYTAHGVPFTWRGIGVPASGEEFTA